MEMQVGSLSHTGYERQDNQDDSRWFTISNAELFIVADGMGGESGGRTAAKMAIETIEESFNHAGARIEDLLLQSIRNANTRVHRMGTSGDPLYANMGTTVVALYISENRDKAYVAHVGDSRIYLHREGRIMRLTKDHSQVQKMVDGGLITEEEAEDHPDSNIITRSIGQKATIEVDVRPSPVEIMPGDKFLLCTDGLSGLVKDAEINAVVESFPNDSQSACKTLVQKALDRGGHDNVTVMLVSFEEGNNAPHKSPAQSFGDRINSLVDGFKANKALWASILIVSLLILIAVSLIWKGPTTKDPKKPPAPEQTEQTEQTENHSPNENPQPSNVAILQLMNAGHHAYYEPNTRSQKAFKMKKGSLFSLMKEEGTWYQVKLDDLNIGWAMQEHFKVIGQSNSSDSRLTDDTKDCEPVLHQVVNGDTLGKLANTYKKHKVTINSLKKMNNLSSDTIFKGKWLTIVPCEKTNN